MKGLVEYLTESEASLSGYITEALSINESNAYFVKLANILRDAKNKDNLHINFSDDLITFIGAEKQDDTDFTSQVLDFLKNAGIKLDKEKTFIYHKINQSKAPVFYIGDKSKEQALRKDIE